mmetsp:Transcript_43494/g.114748  ORF Transcript_43494/g.114748 Transcript_43494/m.114748 type:complete len:210 (-) Transcript_43494:353-982(-)
MVRRVLRRHFTVSSSSHIDEHGSSHETSSTPAHGRRLWNLGMFWICSAIWAARSSRPCVSFGSKPRPSGGSAMLLATSVAAHPSNAAAVARSSCRSVGGRVNFRMWSTSARRDLLYLSRPDALRNELIVDEFSTFLKPIGGRATACAFKRVSCRCGAKYGSGGGARFARSNIGSPLMEDRNFLLSSSTVSAGSSSTSSSSSWGSQQRGL